MKNALRDPSLWTLLLANSVTIFLALSQGWDVTTLMWSFWLQSVIIGVMNVVKILSLKNLPEKTSSGITTSSLISNPVIAKRLIAGFFITHYGAFHLAYLFFLSLIFTNKGTDFKAVFLTGGIFLLNHIFSYFYHAQEEGTTPKDISKILFGPYARVFPMHIAIIAGGFLGTGPVMLLAFLLLKTGVDALMHIFKHLTKKVPEVAQVGEIPVI